MIKLTTQKTPGVPKIVSDDVYVVFDRNSGDVLHLHRVTNYKGAVAPTEKQVQEKLLVFLEHSERRLERKSAGFLKVKPSVLKPDVLLTVDVKKKKLVSNKMARNDKPPADKS